MLRRSASHHACGDSPHFEAHFTEKWMGPDLPPWGTLPSATGLPLACVEKAVRGCSKAPCIAKHSKVKSRFVKLKFDNQMLSRLYSVFSWLSVFRVDDYFINNIKEVHPYSDVLEEGLCKDTKSYRKGKERFPDDLEG
ncbi:Sesquipedalian-2 [Manis pentadactyla]|nr:Sesquipedalian-2 [Manis pentadactyla]